MRWIVVAAVLLSSCAFLDAKAGQDGKLTELHYRSFLRQYSAQLEETKDGVKVTVGAKSESDVAKELLGAAVGAASTLAGKGLVP